MEEDASHPGQRAEAERMFRFIFPDYLWGQQEQKAKEKPRAIRPYPLEISCVG